MESLAPLVIAIARISLGRPFLGLGRDKARPVGIVDDDYIRLASWWVRPVEVAICLANGVTDVEMKFHKWILAWKTKIVNA